MSGKPVDVRVAFYARVSSDQQADSGTIASQIRALRERIQHDGCTVDEELSFSDDGYSGSTLLRPALERLRDAAANGSIDRLYVHSPDRLARKYAYQFLLIEELQRAGVELVFLNRELGRTPEDELLLQVQGVVAEYERAKILERSRRGKQHAARCGCIHVLGGAPYGYRYVRKQEGGGEARYEIVAEEAQQVQQMFAWVGRERLSLNEVARRLTSQGIPTRAGKARWHPRSVWGILTNPAYKARPCTARRAAANGGRVYVLSKASRSNRVGASRRMKERLGSKSRSRCRRWSVQSCSRRWRSNWPRIKNATARARGALICSKACWSVPAVVTRCAASASTGAQLKASRGVTSTIAV